MCNMRMLYGRHFWKNYEIKQIIYDMINVCFKLLRSFPAVKNDCLQHYVNISTKKIYYIFTNHVRSDKKH